MGKYIGVYEDILPLDWCKEVIDVFEHYDKTGFTQTRQQLNDGFEVAKSDKTFYFPIGTHPNYHKYVFERDDIVEYPFSRIDLGGVFADTFWNKVWPEYTNNFSVLRRGGQPHIYDIRVQKTKPSEGYHVWHCEKDTRDTANRIMAFIGYLNDDYEGGETEFLYESTRIQPKAGTLALFPSAFTHTHRGNPPLNGTKYIITGWVEL